jgi:CubicO group peptidase (beta-lactamase class C family)
MTALVFVPLKLDAGYNWSGTSPAAQVAAAALYRTGKDESDWHPGGAWVAQVDAPDSVPPACPVATNDLCDIEAYRPGSNGTLFSPQGGLRISVLGLATIGRMLLRGGEVDGVRLLMPESVASLFTPVWRNGPAGDTYKGLMRAYGPGAQCLSGEAGALDQPVAGRTLAWCGHLGEAYGLLSGLWVDRDAGRVYVYALTGSRDDPMASPHHSAFTGAEEAVLTALVKH